MMTDDKLREACERVAKMWLGAQLHPYGSHGAECYHKEEVILEQRMEVPMQTTNGALLRADNITELASPWGMDLLLNVVEERGYMIQIMFMDQTWHCCLKWAFNNFATEQNKNRYAALIFALDKAGEALNENS